MSVETTEVTGAEVTGAELSRLGRQPSIDVGGVLVTAETDEQLAFVRALVGAAGVTAGVAERLTAALLAERELPADSVVRAARDTALAWRELEYRYGVSSAAEVAAAAGAQAKNRSEYASAAYRAGRMLAVRRGRRLLFPRFQFDTDGAVLPVMERLLAVTRPVWSEWSAALWCAAPNGWLSGHRPADVLVGDPEAIMEAARHDTAPLF